MAKTWKYRKLFPGPRHVPTTLELRRLREDLNEEINSTPPTSNISAGYTYFGQFIDHDLTRLKRHVKGLANLRKPVLDLDSVYGKGFSGSANSMYRKDGTFVLDPTGFGEDRDLPRGDDFEASIVDDRNDENLLIAQIQVLFMTLHNKIVKDLSGGRAQNPQSLYEKAREAVIKVYQYLVLHDFAPTLVPDAVYEKIIRGGAGPLSAENPRNPTLALEFADAAFRLHSLVRSTYQLNDTKNVSLKTLFQLTGKGVKEVNPGQPPPLLGRDDKVDWRHFFRFADYVRVPKDQRAAQVSFVITGFLRDHAIHGPPPRTVDMFELNLRRASDRGLCSGQQICAKLQKKFRPLCAQLGLSAIPNDDLVLAKLQSPLRNDTPLWLYIMREATRENNGNRLGVLGGWIVADVLRTAALNSDIRLTSLSETMPHELHEPFRKMNRPLTIEDVIAYTYDYEREEI